MSLIDNPYEFFETPAACVRALLTKWCPPTTGMWLEPALGKGAIIRATDEFYGSAIKPTWRALDIVRHDFENASPAQITDYGQDFLTWQAPHDFSVCLTNPPFTKAIPFILQAMKICNRTAMLLPLTFLASQERAEFHRICPSDIYQLPWRPSFTGGGSDRSEYAWFVWGEQGNRWFMLDDVRTDLERQPKRRRI